MTRLESISFVRDHGVVLESARGPVPSLADEIAGGPIKGSWWAHPKSQEIFRLTRALRDSDDILVCRLVDGKITFVHRRLWPALVAAAAHFPQRNLSLIREQHTSSGRHVTEAAAFPTWVPTRVVNEAKLLDETTALATLGSWAGANL